MDDDNKKDAAEPSASCGGSVGEPVAWVIFTADEDFLTRSRRDAESWMEDGLEVIPLYRQPQPTLTEAERKAIQWTRAFLTGVEDLSPEASAKADMAYAALTGLLDRLK